MNPVLVAAAAMALSGMLLSGPAQAAGCLKGAVAGGVAGHYAGNHGLLGAGAGCLIGRHYANKHARQQIHSNSRSGSSRPDTSIGKLLSNPSAFPQLSGLAAA